MAPSKKGGPAKAASPPLQACIIALSGTFPGRTQPSTEKDLITPLGGTLAKSITADTTHLVTTEGDYAKPSTKVAQAKSKKIHIVNMTWLEDCLDQNARMDEAKYTKLLRTYARSMTQGNATNGSRPWVGENIEPVSAAAATISANSSPGTGLQKKTHQRSNHDS